MKSLAVMAVLALALASPAMAQKGHNGGNKGGNRGSQGGQGKGSQGRGNSHGRDNRVNHGPAQRGERGRRLDHREFHRNFGEEHRFHPVFFGAYDGFFCGGFEFGFIDPYPVYWGLDPEIYVVDEDGGYFVYDPVYPGVRIAVVLR